MSDFHRDEFLATLPKLIIRYSVLTSSRKVVMESITLHFGEREEQIVSCSWKVVVLLDLSLNSR